LHTQTSKQNAYICVFQKGDVTDKPSSEIQLVPMKGMSVEQIIINGGVFI
jgi:hypothetical protein